MVQAVPGPASWIVFVVLGHTGLLFFLPRDAVPEAPPAAPCPPAVTGEVTTCSAGPTAGHPDWLLYAVGCIALALGAYLWSVICRVASTFTSVAAGAADGAAVSAGSLVLQNEGQSGIVVDGGEEDLVPLRW